MDLEIRKVADQAELNACVKMCASIFKTNEANLAKVLSKSDIDVSAVATIDGKLVGCCLLDTKTDLFEFIKDMNKKDSVEVYKDMRGVYVLALAILPDYQKLGIAPELVQWCRDLGFEYRWGLWNKSAVNDELIEKWYSRKKQIVAETLTTYTVVSAKTTKREVESS